MTIRYEYKSPCCKHEYIEQRRNDEPMIHPMCNVCGETSYELINETVFIDEVIDVEEIQPTLTIEAPVE